LAEAEAALRLRPAHATARTAAGDALMALDRAAEARLQFAEAMRLRPEDPDPVAGFGRALIRCGRPDLARRALKPWAARRGGKGALPRAVRGRRDRAGG
jgi:Flp pilus assembly protein TadD